MSFSGSLLPQSFDFIKLAVGTKDFLLLDHLTWEKKLQEEVYQRLAAHMLPRRKGVGADALLVLTGEEGGHAVLREFRTHGGPIRTGLDSMVAAGRYLFDSARYGISSIPLQTETGEWFLDPLDSHSFRVSLSTTPGSGLPSEMKVFLAAALQGKKPPDWKSSDRVPWPLLVHLTSPEELRVEFPPKKKDGDVVEAMALGALMVYQEGLCGQQVLVRGRNTQVFVEIQPKTQELKVTASAHYVFSGTYSWN